MTRSIQIAPKEFYHLYNRGIEKRKIFLRHSDYDRFVALLYLANQTDPADLKYQGRSFAEITGTRTGDQLVDIVVYCLMPNHFHLLARERIEGGIAKFMQKVTTGYTMYFNKKNERTGSLFQGTYKASHVDDDRYFRYLVSYIHLNPVKLIDPKWKEYGIKNLAKAEHFLQRFQYSSYRDYLEENRPQEILLEKNLFAEFLAPSELKECVTEWLTYSTEQNKV